MSPAPWTRSQSSARSTAARIIARPSFSQRATWRASVRSHRESACCATDASLRCICCPCAAWRSARAPSVLLPVRVNHQTLELPARNRRVDLTDELISESLLLEEREAFGELVVRRIQVMVGLDGN